MNKNFLVIGVVAVVAIAAVAGAIVILNDNDDEASYDSGAFQLISRVNSEGSGLYIDVSILDGSASVPTRDSTDTPFYGNGTAGDFSLTTSNKAAWGGLIFGDPGATSIQHTQLAAIADAVGLEFKQYTATTGSLSANTLYYVTNLNTAAVILGNTDIDGGIIWEPQYQLVIDDANYSELVLTNDIFPGHTCCVIAANHDWLEDRSDVAVKFLAGYVDSVKYIQNALANPGSTEYSNLVNFAKTNMAGGTLSIEDAEDALLNITYLYADDADGSLDKLVSDVAALATDLKDLGFITSSKFKDADEFAKAFIDDSYLKDAIAGNASTSGNDTVKIAAINGDIHQIAVQFGMANDMFSKYGLTVEIASGVTNGGDVATMLLSGDVKIGFLGAPPATINAINGEHILV